MSTTADYLQDLITIKNDIITSIIQIGGTASPNEGLCDIVNSIQDIPTPSSAYAFLHVQSEIDATIELSKNSQLIETKTITSTKVIFDIPESGVYTVTAKKSGSTIYLYSTFANYGTSTRVNGGTRPTTSSGYTNDFKFSTVSGYEWFMFPSLIESSANHVPDYWSYGSSTRYLRIGGSYSTKTYSVGLFCLYNNAQSTTSLAYCGCRLQYIPG